MSDLVQPFDVRMSALVAPIPGPKPAGEDLSFDPEFERVKAEIDKIGTVSNASPNWETVITLASKLLVRTKDVRLATWLAVARTNKSGWQGLAEGLVVLRTLTTKFWDTMYPERRPRARANLFGWLVEQVVAALEQRPVIAGEVDAVKACDQLFKEIDAALGDKLGEMHPGLGSVRRVLASAMSAAPPPAPPDPPPAARNGAATTAPSPAPTPTRSADAAPSVSLPAPAPVATPQGVASALAQCRDTILSAAAILRKQDARSPSAYHLQRLALWLTERDPPQNEGTKTFVPAPLATLRRDFEEHAAQKRWQPLLGEAEHLTSTYVFWLDLHRYVFLALEGLGTEYADAAKVVLRDTVGFIDRFPILTTLTFADATPFADPATVAWIDDNRGAGNAPAKAALAAEEAEQDARLQAAKQAVADGQVGEGVGLLIELSRRAPDGRSRFEMSLAAARMAQGAEKPGLARPILEALVGDIDRYGLESWDPGLCVSVYVALLTAVRAQKTLIVDPSHRETVIIDKISRLDPALAVRMGL